MGFKILPINSPLIKDIDKNILNPDSFILNPSDDDFTKLFKYLSMNLKCCNYWGGIGQLD